MAIVEKDFLENYHIKNIDNNLIEKVDSFNRKNAANNKKINVFVMPFKELQAKYETLYNKIPNT